MAPCVLCLWPFSGPPPVRGPPNLHAASRYCSMFSPFRAADCPMQDCSLGRYQVSPKGLPRFTFGATLRQMSTPPRGSATLSTVPFPCGCTPPAARSRYERTQQVILQSPYTSSLIAGFGMPPTLHAVARYPRLYKSNQSPHSWSKGDPWFPRGESSR